jgi:large subunit ribosomal protein L13
MKSYFATKEEALKNREWVLADAEDKIVGRLATRVATLLRGKHKPTYTPHNDGGDFVVVVNAGKLKFSGKNKASDKIYYRHTGYIGGIKQATAEELLAEKPEELFRKTVERMLPKGTLGRAQLKKLKVYRDAEHPHAAQQMQPIDEVIA